MKTLFHLLALLILVGSLSAVAALAEEAPQGRGHGVGEYADENGDGFNDLAPDADSDGIPNGLDPDYLRPEDGSGYAHQHGQSENEPQGEGFWYRFRRKLGFGAQGENRQYRHQRQNGNSNGDAGVGSLQGCPNGAGNGDDAPYGDGQSGPQGAPGNGPGPGGGDAGSGAQCKR